MQVNILFFCANPVGVSINVILSCCTVSPEPDTCMLSSLQRYITRTCLEADLCFHLLDFLLMVSTGEARGWGEGGVRD